MRQCRLGFGVSLVVAALIAGLTACTPTPAPTPAPTAMFASDEEAFAAAEQLFRDYIDADNASRAGDESVDPLDFLSGRAYEAGLDATRQQEAGGYTAIGSLAVTKVTPEAAEIHRDSATVSLDVCVDLSASKIVDADGIDLTPPDQATSVLMHVETQFDDGDKLITRSSLGGTQC